jgi:hypothetical protein
VVLVGLRVIIGRKLIPVFLFELQFMGVLWVSGILLLVKGAGDSLIGFGLELCLWDLSAHWNISGVLADGLQLLSLEDFHRG